LGFDNAVSRWTGLSLVIAGLLFLVLGGMTGFLDVGAPRRSPIFMWRQTVAVIIGLMLLFGSVGIYSRHRSRSALTMTLVFIAGFVGSALLVAHEWQELFLARDFAINFPGVFARLDDAQGLTPFDWGAMIAVSAFTLGWIALSIATMFSAPFSRWGGVLVILGIFAVPAMTVVLPMPYGPLIGSVIIAGGMVRLGLDLRRAGSTR
jgi:hypothetical protein